MVIAEGHHYDAAFPLAYFTPNRQPFLLSSLLHAILLRLNYALDMKINHQSWKSNAAGPISTQQAPE